MYYQRKGLSIGNRTSQCFALFCLDEIDRAVKEQLRVKGYIGYMDDMLMIAKDKTAAKEILSRVRLLIEDNDLVMNPKSCYGRVSDGVNLLGWRCFYADNGRIVQTAIKASAKRMLTHVRKSIKEPIDAKQRLASYRGYLARGDSHRLLAKLKAVLLGSRCDLAV